MKKHIFEETRTVQHTVYALKQNVSSGDLMIRYSHIRECRLCTRPFKPTDAISVAFMLEESNWALCHRCYEQMAEQYPDLVISSKGVIDDETRH